VMVRLHIGGRDLLVHPDDAKGAQHLNLRAALSSGRATVRGSYDGCGATASR
jgi:hypothetical protein